MRTIVKLRYRLFQRSTGIFFIEDRVTGKQASLQTRDKIAAQRIFNAKNESHQQPAINLQIARAYPERFAQEALGHNSKAVHRAYAKNAQMKLPSLEEYERTSR